MAECRNNQSEVGGRCWGEVGTEGCAKADAEPDSPRTFPGLTAGSGVGGVYANLSNPQGAYTTGSGLVGLGGILLPWELSWWKEFLPVPQAVGRKAS